MRALLLLIASLTTISCASAKLAGRDIVAVAKSPAREWKGVAITGGAVAAALVLDEEIASIVRRNDSAAVNDVLDRVETFGGGTSDKVIAGFLLYGVAKKDSRARAVAFDSIMSSVLASKVITPALKEVTGRRRPSGTGDDASFPSNHATQAFAVATVIANHYDERPWVRWLAYTLAGGVAASRVYNDAHYTSDVIAGAAIGALVGRTVASTNRRERAKWRVAPVRNGAVVSVTW